MRGVGHRMAAAVTVAVVGLGCVAVLAQSAPKMRKLTVPGQGFAIDYPERDWTLVASGNTLVFTVVQRRFEAALHVERTPLQVELSPEDIGDVFLSVEADHIRETTPSATDLKADLQDLGERRVAAFVYRRNGVTGPEQVLQYSMPAGKHLYRIIAVARPDRFDRHLPALQAMAVSLAPQN
jgi:hypothetical protein